MSGSARNGFTLHGVFLDPKDILPHLKGKRAILHIYPQKPDTAWAQFDDIDVGHTFTHGWTPFITRHFDIIIPSK